MSKLYIPTDQDNIRKLTQWAAEQVPWLMSAEAFGPCTAWGIMKDVDGTLRLVGALVLNNYRPDIGDIELNVITQESGWASPNVFRALSDYVFRQLKCNRVSLTLPKGAKRNRKHAEQGGFKMEGTRRKGFYNGHDAILYGMLREECRFFNEAIAA